MRALVLAVVPACTLYAPGDDEPTPLADAGRWIPDAARDPDAQPWDGSAPCDLPAPCPAASPNTVSVCGRLFDLETSARAERADVAISFHDALDLAGDPDGAAALEPRSLLLDACGRFVAVDVPRPSLGFLAIAADDLDAGTPLRRTAVTLPVSSGQLDVPVAIHLLRAATDAAWSEQAGLGARTYVDRGAMFALFVHAGSPAEGVQVDGSSAYFSDADPWTRSTVDPDQATTGPNGAALILEASLQEHSGTGGLTNVCWWQDSLGASVPGMLWVLPILSGCNL